MDEIDFILSSMQYLPLNKQDYLEQHLNVDASSLYDKLFDSLQSLHDRQTTTRS